MKVLIVNNMAPFVWGGAEELAVHLKVNLINSGHDAELLRIPFQWEPYSIIPSQMLLVRSLELTNVDRVIALKFPSYLIRHHNKVLWLLHQYRQAYDLFDAGLSNIPNNDTGKCLCSLINNADCESFAESRFIYTNSEVTKNRLFKYNNIDSTVLLPPINDPDIFLGGEYGDYIFVGGRINRLKRQYLLIEALSQTDKRVKLLIAGPPDSSEDAGLLMDLVNRFDLNDRVKLDLRFLPRSVYASYLKNSIAVAYIPFDEDSLGYVAMEAATAEKALITTSDSGGILGLVKNYETGWVSKPTSLDLASVLENVYDNLNLTVSYGKSAADLWHSMKINWNETINSLLQ